MRASSYNIYVDLPGFEGDMLLVHGYTGAYDRVSRSVATYVRSLDHGPISKPLYGSWTPEPSVDGQVQIPSDGTIATLCRRGYLTSMSQEEEEHLFVRLATALHDKVNVPGYLVMPTYDCNLRCAYCFQDHMRTDASFRHLLKAMSRRTADRIFAGMSYIEQDLALPDDKEHRGQVGFFGGEPLLASSRSIVEYIMDKARQRGQNSFYAVTNGTELDSFADLLGPTGLATLQITLDGPPDEHDKRRVYANSDGSFDRIAQNIALALSRDVNVQIRINVDRRSIGTLPELAKEFYARDWADHPYFLAYTAPVQAANNNVDRSSTFTTWDLDRAIDELREQEPAMAVIERPDDRMTQEVAGMFATARPPRLDPTFCSAHTSTYIFDSFANVYACWERTGDPRLRIGYVDRKGQYTPEALGAIWRSRDVTKNQTCRKCRYALHCGGGCAVLAEGRSGTMFTNYCDGFASRFRAAVAEAYVQRDRWVEKNRSPARVNDL